MISRMDRDTFEKFRMFIYEKSGIYFEDSKEYLLANKLKKRMEELGIQSYEEYLDYLKKHPSSNELQKLFDTITIHETYFFRHINQVKAFTDVMVPELLKTKRSINVWSAACSSGEEPYTLIIALMEKYSSGIIPARFLASDISEEVLEKAKEGIYGEYSLKELGPELKRKYFEILAPGKYKLKDFVKKKCVFRKINLADDRQLRMVGRMDVVFLRNVLIYFDRASRQKLVDKIHNDILNRGGYLVLGATESISRLQNKFKLCHFKMAIAYQKVEG